MARCDVMLPGVSGNLIAATFVERFLIDRFIANGQRPAALRAVHQWWRRVVRSVGPATGLRALADAAAIPFFEGRGYRVLHLEPHGSALVGTLTRDGRTPVVLCVATWDSDPRRAWREAVRAGRVAGARFAMIFTGTTLRIVDARRTWSRRAIDFEFVLALSDERSAAALVGLVEASGLGDGEGSLEQLVRRAEQHGADVCSSLGEGVIEAVSAMFSALQNVRRASYQDSRATFEQALTIVYRLLFLLFAESRALVPTWHHVYRDAYTIDALCRRALSQPERGGLWKSVQAISHLAHHGCRAGDLVVTPFNGRLFSPRHTPLAQSARVSDAVVSQAIVSLATAAAQGQRERIAYADLGVEQLGAVYERVLEYEPAPAAGRPPLTRTSRERKSTGSFYTPRSITDFLVRRALHPLVQGKTSEQILSLRVVDPAMGSGAFLVSACRYLADAVERAMQDEGVRPAERHRSSQHSVRRLVAQRCLFGVDLNPTAVQLARLSLWLATLSADRPLTFLDHHLLTGDSLIGASLADLARDPVTVRQRPPSSAQMPLLEFDTARELAATVLPERFRVALDPDDTPGAVHAKERALAQLTATGTPLARWKQAADLWCAAWFWARPAISRGLYREVLAALTGADVSLHARQHEALAGQAQSFASRHRFFHWELEFPEVFFTTDGQRDPLGGFDVVLGNPPWEVLRADSGDRDERERTRTDHQAHRRFLKEAAVYRRQGHGHTNRYQLFVERALQLLKPGGRLALIVPSGLATDQGSTALRKALLDETRVERIMGFDNREAIFPIHRDVKFLLLGATKGDATQRMACSFGHSDAGWLDALPDDASEDPSDATPITIAPSTLAEWDPEHMAWPWLTDRRDFEILHSVFLRVPVLSDARGWDVTFGRELNASDDRNHFVKRSAADDGSLLPVLEGKHLEPFRTLTHLVTSVIPQSRAAQLVDPERTFARARIAYRDVASATNRLTLIAARLMPGEITTHTLFCSKDRLGSEAQYCLVALLNSLVANFLVRLRVTTHVTTAIMSRLPVPRPRRQDEVFGELAAVARSFERTGIEGHDAAYARLNALAARLYGLTREHYTHVLSTFPLLSPQLRTTCAAEYDRLAESQKDGVKSGAE